MYRVTCVKWILKCLGGREHATYIGQCEEFGQSVMDKTKANMHSVHHKCIFISRQKT